MDLTNIENLLTKQTELLQAIYILGLFIVGCSCAIFVCFLLYKFIKSFY